MDPPRVSVLMAVLNGEPFLTESVRSILGQSLPDLEFVVIDDGSTDGSLPRLTSFARQDPRLRLISHANQGLTRCLNEAAALARGRYLARIDADDVAAPERLARQVARLEQDPQLVAVGGQALRIDADGWPIAPWNVPLHHEEIDAWHLAGLGGGMIHPAAIIRRDAFERVRGYDATLPAAQDFDLWLRLAEIGRLANLPEEVLRYRLHIASVTASRRNLQVQCLRQSCLAARKRRGLQGEPDRLKRHYGPLSPTRQRLQWVRLALKAGYHVTARKHAFAALRHNPLHPLALLHAPALVAIPILRSLAGKTNPPAPTRQRTNGCGN